jgi:3-methyl-2-oxobutanoate hydroxymethyltransferase
LVTLLLIARLLHPFVVEEQLMQTRTIHTLRTLKQKGEKFVCTTCYDASFAHLLSTEGVEAFLVGDSLAEVMQGHNSTVNARMTDMIYHTACVARGSQGALVMADLPFMSYATIDSAMHHSTQLIQAGAAIVKLEGGAWLAPTIHTLTERGVAVCGHIGLTPQSIHLLGHYKVQGRVPAEADRLINDALCLQAAGAQMLVLECVPALLAKEITELLSIPVMGIGAGADTDGQVLVLYDMLGITAGKTLSFVKNFMEHPTDIRSAVRNYVHTVKSGTFPSAEHCFS